MTLMTNGLLQVILIIDDEATFLLRSGILASLSISRGEKGALQRCVIHSFSYSCLFRFPSSRVSMTCNTEHALDILITDTRPQFLLPCLYLDSPTLPDQQ